MASALHRTASVMLLFVLAVGCYLACAQPFAQERSAHACCDRKAGSQSDLADKSCERPEGLTQEAVAIAPQLATYAVALPVTLIADSTAPFVAFADTSPSPPLRI